jgi:hypothetical protein
VSSTAIRKSAPVEVLQRAIPAIEEYIARLKAAFLGSKEHVPEVLVLAYLLWE